MTLSQVVPSPGMKAGVTALSFASSIIAVRESFGEKASPKAAFRSNGHNHPSKPCGERFSHARRSVHTPFITICDRQMAVLLLS
jgi:hypothetical protein